MNVFPCDRCDRMGPDCRCHPDADTAAALAGLVSARHAAATERARRPRPKPAPQPIRPAAWLTAERLTMAHQWVGTWSVCKLARLGDRQLVEPASGMWRCGRCVERLEIAQTLQRGRAA